LSHVEVFILLAICVSLCAKLKSANVLHVSLKKMHILNCTTPRCKHVAVDLDCCMLLVNSLSLQSQCPPAENWLPNVMQRIMRQVC